MLQFSMILITKQDLINAKKEKKLFIVKDFYKDFPSWEDINNFYDLAKKSGAVKYSWFGGMLIKGDIMFLEYYKKAISEISLYHKGSPTSEMMIIHFINRNDNKMIDESLVNVFSKFIVDNPKKIPKELTIKDDGVEGWSREDWDPAIHSDAEDRFFIQGIGQSLWKIFYDNKELNYEVLLSPGDMAYIPKGLIHSVESMCPRHSVSIGFSEDIEII